MACMRNQIAPYGTQGRQDEIVTLHVIQAEGAFSCCPVYVLLLFFLGWVGGCYPPVGDVILQ